MNHYLHKLYQVIIIKLVYTINWRIVSFLRYLITDNLELTTYAETLGEYKDDYSLLGKYFLEIFRALD